MVGYDEALRNWERNFLTAALQLNSNNIARTANAIRVHRSNIYKIARRAGVKLNLRGPSGNAAWRSLSQQE